MRLNKILEKIKSPIVLNDRAQILLLFLFKYFQRFFNGSLNSFGIFTTG
jgi:hypothetical protein